MIEKPDRIIFRLDGVQEIAARTLLVDVSQVPPHRLVPARQKMSGLSYITVSVFRRRADAAVVTIKNNRLDENIKLYFDKLTIVL